MIKEKPLNLDALEDKARIEIKETSERSEFSLEKVLNEKSGNRDNLNNKENHMMYKRPESKPLYILVDNYITNVNEVSNEHEWNHILKKAKCQSKYVLAARILELNERRWNKENMTLSDMLKENRENLDSFLLVKYLNSRLKLQEHFNWLIWAMSIYYFSLYFNPHDEIIKSTFLIQDLGLPSIESLEWFTGFEWKGVFFRIQTLNDSRELFREVKGLEYIFFEYIQMIDAYKIKNESNLLSNELIFPIISYIQHSSLIMMATVCINKIFYDHSILDLGRNNYNYQLRSNTINYSKAVESKCIGLVQLRNTIKGIKSYKTIKDLKKNSIVSLANSNPLNGQEDNPFIYNKKPTLNQNNLSNIQKDASIHSIESTVNINEEITINNYSRDDINHSLILKKISQRNLIKVVDELGEKKICKYKFLIVSVDNLIPDLISNENFNNFAYLPTSESNKKALFFNENNIKEVYSTLQIPKEMIREDTKINFDDIKTLVTHNCNSSDNSVGVYQDVLDGIRFKIFHEKNELKQGKNKICDYFIKIYSDFFSLNQEQLKKIKGIYEGHFMKLKKYLSDNTNLEIKSPSVLMYSLENTIKLKYSLIKSDEIRYEHKIKLIPNIITNLAKVLNNNYNIDNMVSLKNHFERYGINSSLDIFVLKKLKSTQMSNVIKLTILCKLIKKVVYFHEGLSLELNRCLFSLALTEKMGFDVKTMKYLKDENISNFNIFHVFHVILSVLDLQNSSFEYSTFFYKNLNFFAFLRIMKYEIINEHFRLIDDFIQKNSVQEFITDLFNTANKHTFMFLSFLEETFNIHIDSHIKFQASISRENFLTNFKLEHLQEEQYIPKTYIDVNNIAYYLFAKCLSSSQTIDSYRDHLITPKITSLIDQQTRKETANIMCRQSKDTKPLSTLETSNNELNIARLKNEDVSVNDGKELKRNKEKTIDNRKISTNLLNNDSSKKKLNHLNFQMNSNNIMKINYINHKYVEEKKFGLREIKKNNLKNKKKLSFINTAETVICEGPLNKSFYLENLELPFPALLYKMKFLDEEKIKLKIKINKHLCNKYSISRIDILNDWRTQLEILFGEYYSLSSNESVILDIYILQFINAYFVDSDNGKSKELIIRIKEMLRSILLYSPERLAVISLFEGLIIESRNYVESEEFYSKTLVIMLLLYGDPRGRGCSGKVFMLNPLWKLSRQTCILENSVIHEYFKEFFYAQDYIFKCHVDQNSVNNNNSPEESSDEVTNEPNKINSPIFKYNYQRDLEVYKVQNTSENNILIDENDHFINNGAFDYDRLSQDNFEIIKHKYFHFPSISDVKTSYSKYFKSINYVNFLVKNLPILNLSSRKWNDDTLLSLNILNINNSTEIMSQSVMSLHTHFSQKSFNTSRKAKERLFSPYLYENILERLNFRISPPHRVMMTWGHNMKNETSHDYYEKVYLPRMCFKLKEEEIVSASCGWDFSLALTSDKHIFSWGNNESGQCGIHPTVKVIAHPKKIDNLNDVKMISCGNEHALALLNNGELYSWGKGNGGVLGFEYENAMYFPHKLEGFNFESISSGSLHNLALGKDGALYSWGCGEGGQLGHSEENIIKQSSSGCVFIPTKIMALSNIKIKKFSCGEAHSIVLTEDDKLYGWGFTSNGQLGLGFCADSFEIGQGIANSRILLPRLINDISYKIQDIKCGKTFTTFLTDQNELLVCGVNDMNQLGIEQPSSVDHLFYKEDILNNKCMDVVTPTFVECFLKMKVIKVACGESHCLAIIEDNNMKLQGVWSWGSNKFGQLGLGNQIKKSLPRPNNFFFGMKIDDIACGAYHSICIISKDIDKWDQRKNKKVKERIKKIFKLINEDYFKLWTFR